MCLWRREARHLMFKGLYQAAVPGTPPMLISGHLSTSISAWRITDSSRHLASIDVSHR